jgi:hypothetical protein
MQQARAVSRLARMDRLAGARIEAPSFLAPAPTVMAVTPAAPAAASDRGVSEPPASHRPARGLHRSRALRIAAALAGVGALAFGLGHLLSGGETEPGDERAGAAPSQGAIGQAVVTLAPAALERAGLRIEPLAKASFQPTLRAYGTVVDLRGLLDLRDRYAAAEGKAAASRARAAASQREYERLRGLYRDDRNVSAAALESARATAAADRATEQADGTPVQTLAALARQDLGPELEAWVAKGSPALDRLIAGRDVLIRVVLAPGAVAGPPPATATIVADGEPEVPARFVSAAARTDPRIQGLAFYYLAARQPRLLANRNVIALLVEGPPVAGARVPGSAVVWLDGTAWVYLSREPASFARQEIRTDRPVGDGYVVTDLAPGTRVVVQGAALLLSEESRAAHPRPATEEEDTD